VEYAAALSDLEVENGQFGPAGPFDPGHAPQPGNEPLRFGLVRRVQGFLLQMVKQGRGDILPVAHRFPEAFICKEELEEIVAGLQLRTSEGEQETRRLVHLDDMAECIGCDGGYRV